MAYPASIAQNATYIFVTSFRAKLEEKLSEGVKITRVTIHQHTSSYMIGAYVEFSDDTTWLCIGEDGNASRLETYLEAAYGYDGYKSEVNTHLKECAKVSDVLSIYNRYSGSAREILWID